MGNGHFSERPHKSQGDRGCGRVAEDHAGTRKFYGKRAAEKKSRADGTADGDHGELSRREIAVEAGFAFQNSCGIRDVRGVGSQGLGHGAGIVADRLATANADKRRITLPPARKCSKGRTVKRPDTTVLRCASPQAACLYNRSVVKEQRVS